MSDRNPLFPIFLKANQLKVLIVGGGYVALEKLTALWENSTEAEVRLVAPEIKQEIKDYLGTEKRITLLERRFDESDLEDIDWVVIAVGEVGLSEAIRIEAKKHNLLVNVADKPALCDFLFRFNCHKGESEISNFNKWKVSHFCEKIETNFG
jgi:siroheme synthase-like protein